MSESAAEESWLFRVAYDGSAYSGWQIQPNAPTVQGHLQTCLSSLYKQDLTVSGCSRTDAGVHALAQMVTFRPPESPNIPASAVLRGINNKLPSDIRVLGAETRDATFMSRHEAVAKAYCYVLYTAPQQSPFVSRFSWAQAISAPAAMREAAKSLLGTHDFTTFSAISGRGDDDNVRTLHRIDVEQWGAFTAVTVIGDRFLYKMVRRLVGFLAQVGSERLSSDSTESLLAARDRNAPFTTAPPQGLFLAEVFFDPEAAKHYKTKTLPFLELVDFPHRLEVDRDAG